MRLEIVGNRQREYSECIIYMKILAFLVVITYVSCFLRVYSPTSLTQAITKKYGQNRIPYSIANFGQIPYGKQMLGQVVVANPMTNCEFEQDIEDEQTPNRNKFVLVLRGDCTFVNKVGNVEKEGGQLAVIMDNRVEKTESLVMSDDGTGAKITIPSVFIGEEDGYLIMDSSRNNSVILTMKFQTKLSNTAQVSLWLDTSVRTSYIMVRDFKPYYEKVKNQVNLSVNFQVSAGSPMLFNPVDCFFEYFYCAMDPDGPLRPGNGRMVIRQQLRSYKIFKTQPDKWWEYMDLMDEHCIDYSWYEQCANNKMKSLKLDEKSINQFVKTNTEKSSDVLAEFQNNIKTGGIIFFPDVTVNGINYYGQVDAGDVFQLICNSLQETPAECNPFVWDGDKIKVSVSQNHTVMIVVVSSIAIVIFVIFMVCCYRRILRRKLSREMNDQVNSLVSQYITLYETKKIEDVTKPGEAA